MNTVQDYNARVISGNTVSAREKAKLHKETVFQMK